MIKLRYIPLMEILLFASVVASLVIGTVSRSIPWLSLFLIPVAFLAILGNVYVIKIQDDALIFTPLGPFLDAHSIAIKSILKISSKQSYETKMHRPTGAPVPVLKRWHQIEYIDKKNLRKKVNFKIQNISKEQKIFDIIKSVSR